MRTSHLGEGPFTRTQLSGRLEQADVSGALKLVKRIPTLLAFAEDMSVHEVAAMSDPPACSGGLP